MAKTTTPISLYDELRYFERKYYTSNKCSKKCSKKCSNKCSNKCLTKSLLKLYLTLFFYKTNNVWYYDALEFLADIWLLKFIILSSFINWSPNPQFICCPQIEVDADQIWCKSAHNFWIFRQKCDLIWMIHISWSKMRSKPHYLFHRHKKD